MAKVNQLIILSVLCSKSYPIPTVPSYCTIITIIIIIIIIKSPNYALHSLAPPHPRIPTRNLSIFSCRMNQSNPFRAPLVLQVNIPLYYSYFFFSFSSTRSKQAVAAPLDTREYYTAAATPTCLSTSSVNHLSSPLLLFPLSR